MRAGIGVLVAATCCAAALVGAGSASAHSTATGPKALPKQPVAYGIGRRRRVDEPVRDGGGDPGPQAGGNAADAAVAAATTLGVTEPFVAGPGGGGYFVYYRARDHKVFTIDGREKAPAGATPTMFEDATGKPLPFETAVESGVSVGVPGNVATWGVALKRFGTMSLAKVLKPAEDVASKGFHARHRRWSADPGQQTKLAHFPQRRALPAGRARRRRSAPSSRTRTWRAPTGRSAATAGAGSTRARSPRELAATTSQPPDGARHRPRGRRHDDRRRTWRTTRRPCARR